MKWLENLRVQYRGNGAHAFLLYWNITDDFLVGDKFLLLHQVLAAEAPMSRAAIIAFYNREAGVWFPKTERIERNTMRQWFIDLIVEPLMSAQDRAMGVSPEDCFERDKKELATVLDWFGALVRLSWASPKIHDNKEFDPYRSSGKERAPFAAIIFEYLESKLPPDSASSGTMLDRKVFDTFPQWGRQNLDIRETGNIIIVQSETLSGVAQPVKDPLSGFFPVEIPIPDFGEMREIVEATRKEIPRTKDDLSDEQFVKLAKGMPCAIVRRLAQEARAHGRALDVRMVSDYKAKQIKEQSGGLLAARRPPYGYESAGSLDYAVAWAREIVNFMVSGEITAIPKGAIFLGPPGTGKTLLAEVIAHEADIPLITFEENVRNSFVGESEHRLERCLKVIRSNAPCIWFWDEIDKYLRNPDEVYQGDAYVSSNIHGMLLEFFSDPTIQGLVFVLGASNEPERLAPAMLRAGRFDDKVAFLIPKKEQRPGIFEALFRKKQILVRLQGGEFTWEISPVELEAVCDMLDYYIDIHTGEMKAGGPDRPKDVTKKQLVPLTGGYIEKIITHAWRLARRSKETLLCARHLEEVIRNTLPGVETADYPRMNRNALLFADNIECIPPEYEKDWREIHGGKGR